ncbi:MAG TPA: hydrogenase nickel incorporation protein HypB [Dyella sp.]|uniref:hydrogenase nickel incorporation protein HypB n=1 Tax=Dyella sp. TaxID=1869338 RepID=UPI002C25D257|nr:hydrogenase nickel incorporation protein HypB [Dyella sp.]HUB88392.1 hydrogenase nickel incorporation protein HypB [Dyella sp.]
MCDTCGCNITPANRQLVYRPANSGNAVTAVSVLTHLLARNNDAAGHNRMHLDKHGVLAVNLMSSPGAGKTSLLEATIDALKDEFRIAVIEGDLETENDARRIRARGVPAIQITTGSACHLDAHMVHEALHELSLDDVDILFIENVGNLVCPASFDLGQHRHVVLLAVTEGDDKPAKYPVMFRVAEAVLITKTDLLPHLDDFSIDDASRHVRELANAAPIMPLSARKHIGLDTWLDWLRSEAAVRRSRPAAGSVPGHASAPIAAE